MAPEHLEAVAGNQPHTGVGARADVYSLAVTLWELLADTTPFAIEKSFADPALAMAALIADRRAGVDARDRIRGDLLRRPGHVRVPLLRELPVDGALEPGTIEISGARNDDGVLAVTVRGDGVSPAELFGAVLRHGNDELQLLIDTMDREVPPARATVLTGGWADMQSVQRARALVLPELVVSERSQDTSYGATMFAAQLLTPDHH
jgi:serine/threonine protein kinase